MASIEVEKQDKRLVIRSQAFCCDIRDTWENRKVVFVVFRLLRATKTGKPLFTYQSLADGFGYADRRNIHNYIQGFQHCDEDFLAYLRRKRKVDPLVVAAVEQELREEVFIPARDLRNRVNQRLHRGDLTSANIRAALEQIPCTVIRKTVLRELKKGGVHPKEEHVLSELFSVLEQRDDEGVRVHVRQFPPFHQPGRGTARPGDAQNPGKAHERVEKRGDIGKNAGRDDSPEEAGRSEKLLRDGEMVCAAAIRAIQEEPDVAVIQTVQADSVEKLLIPHCLVSALPESVVQMVRAMTMYYSGASLSRLARWFGQKAKSTIYNWIIGLALALWPVIRGWLWQHVKGTHVSIDEKWLKIRKQGHYWFVAMDQPAGRPFFTDLLPTRSKWACRLFLVKIKYLGKIPSVIMTDGLKGYVSAITRVFPTVKHLLCLFHQQQGVTRWVKDHFSEEEQMAANAAKQRMKQVRQTTDPRTVRRRLNRLEQVAKEKGWKILNWITQTRNRLKHVLPAIRSNRYPTTTNEIERFFREFVRFYKTRCGFHAVKSAKREITFFLVVYLVTGQPERGKAPIERILPEASAMPLYRLWNYPFAGEMTSLLPHHVKPEEEMAIKPLEMAA